MMNRLRIMMVAAVTTAVLVLMGSASAQPDEDIDPTLPNDGVLLNTTGGGARNLTMNSGEYFVQRFNSGTNPDGYVVTGVDIKTRGLAGALHLLLCDGHYPGNFAVCTTFNRKGYIGNRDWMHFRLPAPGPKRLASNRRYSLILHVSSGPQRIRTTHRSTCPESGCTYGMDGWTFVKNIFRYGGSEVSEGAAQDDME